jgi:hypothetical protein
MNSDQLAHIAEGAGLTLHDFTFSKARRRNQLMALCPGLDKGNLICTHHLIFKSKLLQI